MALDVAGVKLVVEDVNVYLKALEEAKNATEKFTQSTKEPERPLQNLTVGALTAAVTIGNVFSNALIQGINTIANFGNSLVGLGENAIMTAGRFDELMRVAYLMGTTQEYSSDQVDKMVSEIRQQGIEANTAAQLVTEFARSNFDMADAMKLAKIAQDAAVVSGANSTETLERLKWGVMTMQPEILRTSGILVDASRAYDNYAKSINKSASALDPMEKQQAFLKAVIEEGAKIQGAYNLAMDSGSKIMRSIPRVLDDIMVAIGTPFQEAFYNVMKTMYESYKSISKLVDEGGKLHWIFDGLGATASVLTGYIKNLLVPTEAAKEGFVGMSQAVTDGFQAAAESPQSLIDTIADFLNQTAQNMAAAAESAFSWGFNIIAQLSYGIMEGIATVLTQAMDMISSALSYFLAPGSPPKVAPYIDLWGAAAMNEYLKGFTEADFSIFNSIRKTMNTVFQTLTSAGHIEKSDASSMMYAFSRSLIEGMSGNNVADVINNIAASSGEFADQIRTLLNEEYKLYGITTALEKANEALTKAQKEATSANEDVSKYMEEYNQLASEGASAEVLDAKRKEYETAKKRREEALKTIKTTEKEVETQQELYDSQKKTTDLQQSSLQAVMDIAQDQISSLKEVADALGGAMSNALKNVTTKAPDLSAITKKMDAPFESLKESISQKFSEMFAPITESFDKITKEGGPIDRITKSWENFSKTVGSFYTTYIDPVIKSMEQTFKPVLDDISKLFSPVLVDNIGQVIGVFITIAVVAGAAAAVFAILSAIIDSAIFPIVMIIAAVALLKTAWDTDFLGMRTTFIDFWDNGVVPVLDKIYFWFTENIPVALAFFSNTWNNAVNFVNSVILSLSQTFTSVSNWISEKFSILSNAFSSFSDFISGTWWPYIQSVINFFGALFSKNFEVLVGVLNLTVIPALAVLSKAFSDLWNLVLLPFASWLHDIAMATFTAVGNYLGDLLVKNVQAAIDVFKWLYDRLVEMAGFINGVLIAAFEGLKSVLGGLTTFFNGLADVLNKMSLPSWLTPGSPTPLEIALYGIEKVLNILSGLFSKVFDIKIPSPLEALGTVKEWATSFNDIKSTISGGVSDILTSINTLFTTLNNLFITAIANQSINLATMRLNFSNFILAITTSMVTFSADIIQKMANMSTTILSDWASMWTRFIQLIIDNQPIAAQSVLDLANGMINALNGTLDQFFEFGKNIILRIDAGIEEMGSIIQEHLSAIAREAVNAALAAIAAFNPSTWQSPKDTPAGEKPGGGGGGGYSYAEKEGGTVKRGTTYLTGEVGPELFIPGQNGYIINNQLTQLLSTVMGALQAGNSAQSSKAAYQFASQADTMFGKMRTAYQPQTQTPGQYNYNLTMNTKMNAQTVKQGFEMFRLLGAV